MTNSMTGFGNKEAQVPDIGRISVDLRSSNHKFLEVVLHLPVGFLSLEDRVKKEIEASVRRGRVVCAVNIIAKQVGEVFVNRRLLKNYIRALADIQQDLRIKESAKIDTLINLPGVVSLAEVCAAKETIWPHLKKILASALADLLSARKEEGKILFAHLKKEADALRANLVMISARFKKVIPEKAARIKIDEERAAFFKDTDITEEMERLNYHIKNFLHRLAKGSPVGKELDFIAQEMQREANTVGAKSCDTLISGRVVQLKSRIEKIREQAQNVE